MNYKLFTNIKRKIKKNFTLGAWVQTSSIENLKILCHGSFDWICIDMEHGQICNEKMSYLISIIENNNVSPMVRISESNENNIKHALDSGAHGIILPMLKNYNEIIRLKKSSQNPPIGSRGVGFFKANDFGNDFEKYLKNFVSPIFIPIIENIEIIKYLEKILSEKLIDVCFIGPYDLSASLGEPGNFKSKKFVSIIKYVKNICKKYKCPLGIHAINKNLKDINY